MPKTSTDSSFFHHSNLHDFRIHNPYVILVIVARMAAAISIIWYPFIGVVTGMIIDALDWYVLKYKAKYSKTMYHLLDKNLDWIAYSIEYLYAWGTPFTGALTVLLFYRMIGHLLFLRFEKQWILFVFGNYFELTFLWFIAAPHDGITSGLSLDMYWLVFMILIGTKLMRELYLRIIVG